MAQKCRVCTHKKVEEINRRLREGESINSLHKLYGMSRQSLTRHKKVCLTKRIGQKSDIKEGLFSSGLMQQVEETVELLRKLIFAVDEYLTDPNNPDKYFIGARGTEVDIAYQETDPKTGELLPSRQKANLQELLQKVESAGYIIRGVNVKSSDPRDLLLKTVDRLAGTVKQIDLAQREHIRWEHEKRALDKVSKEGNSTISFEQQVQTITKKVTIAMQKSNSEELMELAGLPDIDK